MERLIQTFSKTLRPELKTALGVKSIEAAPKPTKIVVNIGTGKYHSNDSFIAYVIEQLTLITGQKPTVRKARKSIASFKLREGMPIGLSVTLRGKRMFDFIDKLVNVSLARVRDFKGISEKSFDGRGNYTLGIKEHIVFPEVVYESIDKVFSLEITIVTTAKDNKSAYLLLKTLGFPFRPEADATFGINKEG